MAFTFKPILAQNDSVVAGIATMALVFGIYNNKVGAVSEVHMSPANDGNIAASIKKAGIVSAALVAGLFLITHDANIVILGGSAIVAEELTYRHAHMADEASGMIQVTPSDYQQAPTAYSVSQHTNYEDQ